MYVLAGDIGGTNCRLALYKDREKAFEHTYPSQEQPGLEAAVSKFLTEARSVLGPEVRPQRACFGVAGPVVDDTSKITNLPWFIDARALEQHLAIKAVSLLNDFQAAALGVTVLKDEHLINLGGEAPAPEGPCVVTGAGTGLGVAFLVWSAADERYQVVASEGGHMDFAPRTALECSLMLALTQRYGRVSLERVLSGAGLADVFHFLESEPEFRKLVRPETRAAMTHEDPAAVVTKQALAGSDPVCLMAVNIFVSVLGGLAGNLALTVLATGGVFIAGGIGPRIAPLLQNGVFREAFEAKGRMKPLVSKLPAFLIVNPDLGLLGAAVQAARI